MEPAWNLIEPPSSSLSPPHVLDEVNGPGGVMHQATQLHGDTALPSHLPQAVWVTFL